MLDEPQPRGAAGAHAARYAPIIDRRLPLDIEPAELTTPLEELENLRADSEQARWSVAEDIAF